MGSRGGLAARARGATTMPWPARREARLDRSVVGVAIARDDGRDHLYLVNGSRCEKIDCSDAGYPYFQNLANDIRDRTETAMPQAHCFKVCELALQAQAMADAGRA